LSKVLDLEALLFEADVACMRQQLELGGGKIVFGAWHFISPNMTKSPDFMNDNDSVSKIIVVF
jgi:hypothetical protein